MKKISYWASSHIKYAQILIVILKILLAFLAYYFGILLLHEKLKLPSNIIYGFTGLALIFIVVIYPDQRVHNYLKKRKYLLQKTCDLILPLCSFLVIATMVSNSDNNSFYSETKGSNIIKIPTAEEILASGKTRGNYTKKEKRILKKEFYKQLKIYAVAKISGDKEGAGNAWKIILVIIGAVGLTFLLAGLACSLSCNGSDAAAVIVGLVGLVAIIWGAVVLIKRIKRGKKREGN